MPDLGETLGRYTLLKRLAAGGMGEIFLAARMGPLGFAPPVALKVLRDELASDAQFIEMLVDEAKISMFLNHQNVVSVLDFGEDHGRYYIAMELVQGVTLKGILDGLRAKGRRLHVATAVYITNELCRALKYAHTRTNHAGEPLNIVHRDVTPANVLISVQGEVKLTDFGIARAKNRVHQTQAGVLKGKFGYMAPEMLRYEAIDARADIFCAGVMLYEMVAGQHPVEGASIMDAITRLEEKDVRPPSAHNGKLPPEMDAIVMKALEPKPLERWQSAAELAAALQDLILRDATRRIEMRHGSESVTALIRELFPQAFEPPLPREQAEQIFAMVRQRTSLPHDAVLDPDRISTGEDLVASDSIPGRDFQRDPSGISVRPAIQMETSGRSASEVASLPTREAMQGLEIEDPRPEPSTIIPVVGRRGGAHAAPKIVSRVAEVEVDTDEQGRGLLNEAAAVVASQRASTISLGSHDPAEIVRPTFSDNATMAFSAVRAEDEDAATGEIVIRFPESGSVNTREELLVEPLHREFRDPTLPGTVPTREAIERAHFEERTIAQPDGYDAGQRVDDGKTVAGMDVPDWDSLLPGRGRSPSVQVVDPPTALEEVVRDFAEQELPQRQAARAPSYEGGPPAYDDGATAFGNEGSPRAFDDTTGEGNDAPRRNYNDDKTAFGMGSVSAEEPATIIPDSDLVGVPRAFTMQGPSDGGGASQQFSDDTLLDGISKADIERAKAEIGLHKKPLVAQRDDDVGDTRLRQDALIEEAMAELGPQPKKISGPLKVKAPDAPPGAHAHVPGSVSPSLGTPARSTPDGDPFKTRTPAPPRVTAREVPRPVVAPVDAGPKPLANVPTVAPVEIGSATGRWMRGELAANDLSWGDDAAARRAVATRNAPAGNAPAPQPQVQDPRRTAAGVPRPGMQTQGGYMVPNGPQTGVGGLVPLPPQGMNPGMNPGMGPMTGMGTAAPPAYPVPNQGMAARRSSRGLTLGLAMATVAVALAAVATVLLRTKIAWPEVTFETTPPGAAVRLDDRVMSERTPSRFAVRPNVDHRIELRLEGYAPRELGDVELGFFGSRTYQVALEKLSPKIRTNVDARVFVNDILAGTGKEVELINVNPAVEVKLRVEADGYIAWSQTFARLADVPVSIDVPLTEQPPPPPPAPEPPKRGR